MQLKTKLASLIALVSTATVVLPAMAESGTVIRFSQAEVESVCDYYVNNRQAFDKCVELNLESGVQIHYTESSARGPSYATNWDFCPLNTLEYAPDSPASNAEGYWQPCL
ncbi:MAG: hypothetical protein WA984_00325 [Phormidesmis sp.]